MSEHYLGWQDPIDQLLCLQTAMKYVCARTLGRRERFDRATFPLVKYRASDFPERLRRRVTNIHNARTAVRRTYATDALFRFDLLPLPQLRSLQADIIALHEARLLDIGRMNTIGGLGHRFYEIVYPKDAEALTTTPRGDL